MQCFAVKHVVCFGPTRRKFLAMMGTPVPKGGYSLNCTASWPAHCPATKATTVTIAGALQSTNLLVRTTAKSVSQYPLGVKPTQYRLQALTGHAANLCTYALTDNVQRLRNGSGVYQSGVGKRISDDFRNGRVHFSCQEMNREVWRCRDIKTSLLIYFLTVFQLTETSFSRRKDHLQRTKDSPAKSELTHALGNNLCEQHSASQNANFDSVNIREKNAKTAPEYNLSK